MMTGKALGKVILATIVIPVAVQVFSQLALIWIEQLTRDTNFRVNIRDAS